MEVAILKKEIDKFNRMSLWGYGLYQIEFALSDTFILKKIHQEMDILPEYMKAQSLPVNNSSSQKKQKKNS